MNIKQFKILCTQSTLFEDEDGVIWHCDGKLANSNLPYLVIHWCAISKDHHVSNLFVEQPYKH